MFDLGAVQAALAEFGLDGWLLYDFRGLNILAARICGIPEDELGSRRWFYYVPASGQPTKIVHRIEQAQLEHLPGETRVYLSWQQLRSSLQQAVSGSGQVAMEYSPLAGNPYVSRVDAGTVELVRSMGPEVVSSGNLIQYFEACWSDEQWEMHCRADQLNQAAFEMAWQMIVDAVTQGRSIRETDVQSAVMDYYAQQQMTTYHPPIVAVGPHAGDPHYAPQSGQDAEIRAGDLVLLDMWAKLDQPEAVYSDLTKMGFVGDQVPERHAQVFRTVADARDAGIELVKRRFAAGEPLFGWEVDQANRDVIDKAGYGEFFIHRTGHNIGQETHGNGAHMDNLETQEDRLVMRRTCFSIEPGIYLSDFGIRSEVNVFIDAAGEVHVTGGVQQEILALLA